MIEYLNIGLLYWAWTTIFVTLTYTLWRMTYPASGDRPTYEVKFIVFGGFLLTPILFICLFIGDIYTRIMGKPFPGWRRWLYLPITIQEIQRESNITLRRDLIEKYGKVKFLLDVNAEVLNEDEFGVLYQEDRGKSHTIDEELTMVKLKNSTPEPDGTYKEYFLRVPPWIRTAKQGVAWSFGKSDYEYSPVKET